MSYSSLNKTITFTAALIIFEVSLSLKGYSQVITEAVNENEKIFLVRTKQFNEFIDRFNYKTNFAGVPADSVFRSKIPRNNMLNALFDLSDPRIDPSSSSYSKEYVDKKELFISEVTGNDLLISKYSDKIIAEAESRIIFKGTSENISIFLSQEVVGNDMIKWIILDVKGNIFDFLKTDTTYIRFIPPSSNETDFMNLKRALEDVNYLHYYAYKEYEPDYLTLFFYLVNAGMVKFEFVEEVIYHIIDLPGWCIKIKEFNRSTMNSGWLISDLSENFSGKDDYLKRIK